MIKSPDCSTSRRGLKWITTDHRNGATSSLAETKQIWRFASEKKKFALWASFTFSFPILMRQQWTSCWVWPDRANTIPGISCISNLFFCPQFQGVGVNDIPVVPGRLDPPAEGEKKEFVLEGKLQCKHHTTMPLIIWEITEEQLKIQR